MTSVRWHGVELGLLPERAALLAETGTLVVADLHLGKPDAFRSAGIPVPGAVTGATLGRLERVLRRTRAGRLVVLGDLLHARAGRSGPLDEAVAAWRGRHRRLEVVLVRGNHDLRAGDPPEGWDIRCADEPLEEPPLCLCHHAEAAGGRPCLAGHVHPAVRLGDRDGFRCRRPCFWFSGATALLPAFGDFTGAFTVRPGPGDLVYAVDGDDVLDVSRLAARRGTRPL